MEPESPHQPRAAGSACAACVQQLRVHRHLLRQSSRCAHRTSCGSAPAPLVNPPAKYTSLDSLPARWLKPHGGLPVTAAPSILRQNSCANLPGAHYEAQLSLVCCSLGLWRSLLDSSYTSRSCLDADVDGAMGTPFRTGTLPDHLIQQCCRRSASHLSRTGRCSRPECLQLGASGSGQGDSFAIGGLQ